MGVVTQTPPFESSEIALILSAGSPSIVVSSVGVGVSVPIDQRMSPRGVPTHTSPDEAARHFTGRESENERTRTGAPSPVWAVLRAVLVFAAGPQLLLKTAPDSIPTVVRAIAALRHGQSQPERARVRWL